ncbi:MAG: glycosyltransferase [Candidatus Competibacteraceae bacterium]|nr:glycosyltransferase [Candidatus Competibacteraceae bacterium]
MKNRTMALIPSAIHQFSPGCDVGDGITNGMFFTQKILRSLGFQSDIFSIHIPDVLKNVIKNHRDYISNPDQVLIVHHSMGTDNWDWVGQQNSVKIMLYHNITPSDFFPEGSSIGYYAELGRKQLANSAHWFVGAIGVSEYNSTELIAMNYQPVVTIPLLLDLEKNITASWDQAIVDQYRDTFNLLFVGRIVEHKKQHELVELFADFNQRFSRPAKLILVGGTTSPAYETHLRAVIHHHQLQDQVVLPGKVSSDQLYGYYRAADVFVCLSEHEGFGMPLIEAMCFDVPVVALNTSNIGNTLGASGILFNQKRLPEMAACLKLLAEHSEFRRRVKRSQRRNLQRFSLNQVRDQLISFFHDLGINVDTATGQDQGSVRVQYQLEGPFDSSYSLALVNRELAMALRQKAQPVALYSTEGPGDFPPNPDFLTAHPEIAQLWQNSKTAWYPEVVIRNLYPPRVNDARGVTTVLGAYGWEESSFPPLWIDEFNRHLNLVATTSNYVSRVLLNNGFSKPCVAIGDGVDHILAVEPEPLGFNLGSGFRFLHISSAFPRKGIDVLFNAWVKAFSDNDPVVLIIKTFPNPHNTVAAQAACLSKHHPHHAPIIVIDEDISLGALASLYKECNALVAPSRGEGFGLPMAEAMLFDLPVIVTGYGGQTDFCTEETAWLIDYQFAKAQTHLGLYDSVWAEPSSDHLADRMRQVYLAPAEAIKQRTTTARNLILSRFTWSAVANRLMAAVKALDQNPMLDPVPRLGWVSTWNTKCGIATYSKYLVSQLDSSHVFIFANRSQDLTSKDEPNVLRCWNAGWHDQLEDLASLAKALSVSSLVIQFNFGFFRLDSLATLIETLSNRGIKLHLFLHSTADVVKPDFNASLKTIAPVLRKVDRILVHSMADLNQLKNFELVDNVTLFPHGVSLPNEGDHPLALKKTMGIDNKRIIASYGFLLPHKGISNLIKAFSKLLTEFEDLHLLLVNACYPVSDSEEERMSCEKLMDDLKIKSQVTMVNDFLQNEESLALLRLAELIVFPYQNTQESASGAVKQGLAAGRPILCSPLPIFEDVADAVLFLPGVSAEDIEQGVRDFLTMPGKPAEQINRQLQWCKAHHWPLLAQRLWTMIASIEANHPVKPL